MMNIRPLVKALDAGYMFRPHEMLSYFLIGLLTLWGLPVTETVPEEARERVAEAIGVYSSAVQSAEPFEDILGPVYMELGSRGQRQFLGQYFTPWEIAMMMAAMTFTESPIKPDGSLTTILEPTSGSGVMLLATCNRVLKLNRPGICGGSNT